jgi:hypothetical protein
LTSVSHLDSDLPALLAPSDRDPSAFSRELDRVRQQIPQNLLEAVGVADERYPIRRCKDIEC